MTTRISGWHTFLAGFVFACATFGLGVIVSSIRTVVFLSPSTQQPKEAPGVPEVKVGTLQARIWEAKANNQDYLHLSELACGWEIGSLQEALARDTVLLADVVELKTYADSYNLYSWYKFRIKEILSQRGLPKYLEQFPEVDPPVDQLPLQPDEFLMRETNGSLKIDGVNVTQESNGARYLPGQTYLLFMHLNRATNVGVRSATDPEGVFSVDGDGTLRPYLGRPYPMSAEIAAKFGNSIDKLRNVLKD